MAKNTTGPRMVYEDEIIAPDDLKIPLNPGPNQLAKWFDKVVLYSDAMYALNRVVLLKFDEEEGTLHLSSIDDQINV